MNSNLKRPHFKNKTGVRRRPTTRSKHEKTKDNEKTNRATYAKKINLRLPPWKQTLVQNATKTNLRATHAMKLIWEVTHAVKNKATYAMKINFRLHAVKQTWQNAVETNLRATHAMKSTWKATYTMKLTWEATHGVRNKATNAMKINFRLHAVEQTWQNAVKTNLRATHAMKPTWKGDIRHETNFRATHAMKTNLKATHALAES